VHLLVANQSEKWLVQLSILELKIMSQLNVAKAEQDLKAAKEAQAAQQRDQDRLQLAKVRAEIRAARNLYTQLRHEIQAGEQAVAIQQSHVDGLVNLLTEHNQARPACADFLPDDPEVKAWQARYDDLVQRRNLAIARREQIRGELPPTLDAAKYEGNFGLIANLERSEANLVRKLKGERIGATPDGGVFRVL
jgi:hypothetical protein